MPSPRCCYSCAWPCHGLAVGRLAGVGVGRWRCQPWSFLIEYHWATRCSPVPFLLVGDPQKNISSGPCQFLIVPQYCWKTWCTIVFLGYVPFRILYILPGIISHLILIIALGLEGKGNSSETAIESPAFGNKYNGTQRGYSAVIGKGVETANK